MQCSPESEENRRKLEALAETPRARGTKTSRCRLARRTRTMSTVVVAVAVPLLLGEWVASVLVMEMVEEEEEKEEMEEMEVVVVGPTRGPERPREPHAVRRKPRWRARGWRQL